jgi:hypothetical protein
MSNIKKIRENMNSKLDKWEAEATAFQAQLELNKEQVKNRVEQQKQRLEEISQQMKDKIDAAGDYTEETKAKIKSSFEHMQTQLAQGVADTRDGYQDWKQKVQSSIAGFEKEVEVALDEKGAQLDAVLDALKVAYVKQTGAWEAEIDAMQAQLQEAKSSAKADFEKYKQDAQSKINDFRQELNEKRKLTADKFGAFEAGLSSGATQIKDSVKKLFS